jgi:hypothetical protein
MLNNWRTRYQHRIRYDFWRVIDLKCVRNTRYLYFLEYFSLTLKFSVDQLVEFTFLDRVAALTRVTSATVRYFIGEPLRNILQCVCVKVYFMVIVSRWLRIVTAIFL